MQTNTDHLTPSNDAKIFDHGSGNLLPGSASSFADVDAFVRQLFAPQVERNIKREDKVNNLGDGYLVAGKWGADIAVQRADELDQACFHFALHQKLNGGDVHFLDVGGGIGAESIRLSSIGARGTLSDLQDQGQTSTINQFLAKYPAAGTINFMLGDVRQEIGSASLIGKNFNIFYSQRMWSSVPYSDALNLLKDARANGVCSGNAAYFVSAIRLHSEIGATYPHRKRKPSRRWSPYAPDMARKHGVFGNECLYTRKNLVDQFEKAGLIVVDSWRSSFGNPKIIAVSPSTPRPLRRALEGFIKAVRAERT